MPRTAQDVTDAELAVMQRLWDDGASTIRQLTEELYPGGGTSNYATVQKLLERLESKGNVRRDRRAAVHVFSATINRDELIGHRLQSIAEQLCNGSMAPLVTHLVKAQSLSAAERQSLRELIGELDGPAKRRSRR